MNEYQVFKSGPKKGQPKTLTDRVVRYLVERRCMREVTSKSRFRQFINNTGDQNYFVGSSGAIRAGRTASDSVSLTDQVHRLMKIWERNLEMAAAETERNINNLDGVIHNEI